MAISMSRSSNGLSLNFERVNNLINIGRARPRTNLLLLEVGPGLLVTDHETLCGIRVTHLENLYVIRFEM